MRKGQIGLQFAGLERNRGQCFAIGKPLRGVVNAGAIRGRSRLDENWGI